MEMFVARAGNHKWGMAKFQINCNAAQWDRNHTMPLRNSCGLSIVTLKFFHPNQMLPRVLLLAEINICTLCSVICLTGST